MENLKIFENSEFGQIRTMMFNNEPMFCLADVCRVLEIKNVSDCKNRLKKDGVVTTEVGVQTGTKADGTPIRQIVSMNFINESNLYKTIFQSRKESAERFTDWVTSDVLPSIRKHGMYATEELIANPDLLISVAQELKAERERSKQLKQKIENDKPKTIFADAVATSSTSILIGDLAKIIKQNGVDIGQKRLFSWLRENGYLIKRKGADWNSPTQKSMEMELFEVKETAITHSDGHVSVSKTTKVTGKGQQYFINKFLQNMEAIA